jgi:hypothetical protein
MVKQSKKFLFVIIGVTLCIIFFIKQQFTNNPLDKLKSQNETKTFEIIVSRYKEDLKWTLEYPFNQYKYIVYNKGDNETFEKKYITRVYNLKNEGKCDHSNLYHIYKNYYNLKDITIFLPGCINEHYHKYEKSKLLLHLIKKYNNAFCICDFKTNDLYKDFYNFKVNSYISVTKANVIADAIFVKSDIRPFGVWYNNFVNVHEEYVSYFAIFSVDKRDIYNNTQDYYFKLMKELEGSIINEKGFYIEYSLMAIFNPMKYTYKIDYSNCVYNFIFRDCLSKIFKYIELNGSPVFQIPLIWLFNINYFLKKYTSPINRQIQY